MYVISGCERSAMERAMLGPLASLHVSARAKFTSVSVMERTSMPEWMLDLRAKESESVRAEATERGKAAI